MTEAEWARKDRLLKSQPVKEESTGLVGAIKDTVDDLKYKFARARVKRKKKGWIGMLTTPSE